MLQTRPTASPPRRGVILLVVMILLALFAVVGITFVLYAETEAVASRVHKEAESPRRAEAEPELLLSYYLSQLLYDVQDSRAGTGYVDSAMRGHSLARSMMGYYDPSDPPPQGATGIPPNTYFYSGLGRLHSKAGGNDEYFKLNYSAQGGQTQVSDPEHYGPTHAPTAPLTAPYAGGFNAGYTYPDLNNAYLASQRPTDGAILVPSFLRPWAKGAQSSLRAALPASVAPDAGGCDVKNYMQGPGFFDGKTFHNNDSIWMDLGYPIRYGPDGTRYKPLFASLVLDLDNRINLQAHGNIRGAGQTHVSNQGYGPWEVNASLLSIDGNPKKVAEWRNLFVGKTGSRYGANGIPEVSPNPPPPAQPLGLPTPPKPRFFSQTDYDGCDENNGFAPSGKITLPNNPNNPFPSFGGGYGNFSLAEVNNHPGLYDVFQPQGDDQALSNFSNMEAILRYGDTGSPAMTSNLFNLLPMNLGGDPSGKSQAAEAADAARIRRLITLLSSDVDQPVVTPWIWDRSQNQLGMPANPPTSPSGLTTDYPTGQSIPFPTTQGVAIGTPPPAPQNPNMLVSEFGPDWRSTVGRNNGRSRAFSKKSPNPGTFDFGRLDMNRSLPDFPDPATVSAAIAAAKAGNVQLAQAAVAQAKAALVARQTFAKDIFMRLCQMTNAPPCYDDTGSPLPSSLMPPPTNPDGSSNAQYDALRWFAQIAVNIVDYIDNDDIITPFNWNPNVSQQNPIDQSPALYPNQPLNQIRYGWVFGTELPRVVIDEAYCEYNKVGQGKNATYNVDLGIKLLNTFSVDNVRNDAGDYPIIAQGLDPQTFQPTVVSSYRLMVCKPSFITPAAPPQPATVALRQNVTGDPITQQAAQAFQLQPNQADLFVDSQGNDTVVDLNKWYNKIASAPPDPTDGTQAANARQGTNVMIKACNGQAGQGYFWVCTGDTAVPPVKGATPDIQLKSVTASLQNPPKKAEEPVVVLQKLLCPLLPNNDDPTSPSFNPYVTVDYMENIPVNSSKKAGGGGGNSMARRQPYAASTATTQQPTFQAPFTNSVAQVPDWLVHLDRQLVSIPEVFQVSAFAPSHLTHQFIDANGKKYAHTANWFDQRTRLYRSLEFFNINRLGNGYMASPCSPSQVGTTFARESFPQGGGYSVGVVSLAGTTRSGTPWAIMPGTRLLVGSGATAEIVQVTSTPTNTSFVANFVRQPAYGSKIQVFTLGDRLAGRININTLLPDTVGSNGKPASTVFRALCDAQPANYFTQDDVDQIFQNMMASRTIDPSGTPGPLANEGNGGGDRPFLSTSIGATDAGDTQYPAGVGINDTLLRNNGSLFNAPTAPNNPFLQQSLLTKIWNNTTIRSNVFAVWVTVGFFQVTDAKGTLGAEIGKSEGRNVRHRMFSIVDRSAFAKQDARGGTTSSTLTKPLFPPGGQATPVWPAAMTDIHQGSTVYYSHQAQSDNGSISGVQQPDKLVVSGLKHAFDVGSTVSFTVQVPVMDANGNPVILPNGLQATQNKTFSATLVSPMTDGKGVLQVSDPSILKFAQAGNTQAKVQDSTYTESESVIQVLPSEQQPTNYITTIQRVYNPGDTIWVNYNYPQASPPANPGPQNFWNTRDDHGLNNPILYFSIID